MEPLLLFPLFIAFYIVYLVLPMWIKKAKKISLVWEDMNTYEKCKVAGSGGLIVILGFILSVLFYIALKTFYFHNNGNVVKIFALTTTILMLAGIGIIDDLLGWQHGGLSKRFRIILCFFAAIPLMVINSGHSVVSLPFLGKVNLGLFYPLLLVPLGIVGTSTTFNFLAGFNGLEAGQGILILTALSGVALFTNSSWISLIGLCMVFALIGFWIFNKYPAKVFPGDVLTYPIGGLIAVIAIFGDFERIALFFFIPYIIEVILKARGKLKKQSFGKPNKDNSLTLAHDKIYSLNHFAIWFLKKIKRKVYQKDVIRFIFTIQIIIIILGFIIFSSHIF